MSESLNQALEKIREQEQVLRASLADAESRFAVLDGAWRGLRREKLYYELAKRLGPMVTQVDVWPLYALYVLVIVGIGSLVAFGLLRAVWLPTWVAAIGASAVAVGAFYCGWKLRGVEREIRRRYPDQPLTHLQRLSTEIQELDQRIEPLVQERRGLQRQLADLIAKKEEIENQASIEKEKQRQAEELRREQEAHNKKQAKLRLLNSKWDTLRGIPFEEFLAEVLRQHGYDVELTPASGDQGVDLVAVIFGQRVAIQAKGYSNMVGNESVQQVVAGKRFYNCTHAAVITNSSFTHAALALAESNDCLMIDYTVIPTLILHGWPEKGVRR